jgi:hypothetical protein
LKGPSVFSTPHRSKHIPDPVARPSTQLRFLEARYAPADKRTEVSVINAVPDHFEDTLISPVNPRRDPIPNILNIIYNNTDPTSSFRPSACHDLHHLDLACILYP